MAGLLLSVATTAGAGPTDWKDVPRLCGAAEQVEWAVHYEYGEGVDQDLGKAIFLYCQAARSNDPRGQYGLGWIYANGRGVARNDDLAAAWFRLAAAISKARIGSRVSPVGCHPPNPPWVRRADAPWCARKFLKNSG